MSRKCNTRHTERGRSRYNSAGADRYGTYANGVQLTSDRIAGAVSRQDR